MTLEYYIAPVIDLLYADPLKYGFPGFEANRGKRNIFVCGYPISGNSWIAYMVSYVMNRRYFDIDGAEWSDQRIPLKALLAGNNKHWHTKKYDAVLKTHGRVPIIPAGADDRIIYIVRDGRDAANSYYHRIQRTWPIDSTLRRKAAHRITRLLPRRFVYTTHLGHQLRFWVRHVEESISAGLFIVRYEDVLSDPVGSLKRIVHYLDRDVWNLEVAQEAVRLFRFDEMKKAAARSSAKVHTDRSGAMGDWKGYFSKSDYEVSMKYAGDVLRKLAYEPFGDFKV